MKQDVREGRAAARAAPLEISQQAEIGIDDFFRIPSLRTIELALSGSSKNEAYSVKSRAKNLSLALFRTRMRTRFSLPPTRVVTPCRITTKTYGRPSSGCVVSARLRGGMGSTGRDIGLARRTCSLEGAWVSASASKKL